MEYLKELCGVENPKVCLDYPTSLLRMSLYSKRNGSYFSDINIKEIRREGL